MQLLSQRGSTSNCLSRSVPKQMEKHLNNLNSESLKVGLKIHKGKTKYMTNHADSEDILIDQQKIEKVTEFKYLDKPHTLKTPLKKKYMPESEQRGAVLEKIRKHSRINNSPFHLKKQVMDQCILPTMTYGCQTWSLNDKHTENRSKSNGKENVRPKAKR